MRGKDVRSEEVRERLAFFDMANLYRRDLIIEERARDTGTLMLNLYTLLRRISMPLTQIALEMGNAILMTVDLLSIKRLKLRADDLQEVLEHVLRLARAREVSVQRVRLDT